MINKSLFSSNSDEWATPQNIFDSLNEEFNFNLDPCATESNHKCDLFYTKENDGLSQKWGGTGSFVTRHIATSRHGSKNHSEKRGTTRRLLFC